MQDAYRHCAALVREADRDRFIAALFAPAERRPHLLALHAFDLELARIGHVVREALAGEIRLQWWRDALAGQAHGDAMANPVAAALLDTIACCGLPATPLSALIDARAHALYAEPFPTLEACAAYGRHTTSAVVELAAHILDPAAAVGEAAGPAGAAAALAGLLQAFPQDAARGRILLPLDVLDRHGVAREQLGRGPASLPLLAAFTEIAGKARAQLDDAGRAWPAVSPGARPAFLPLAPLGPLLGRLARSRDPYRPTGLAPWRRQWLIWRAARRGIL